MFANAAGGSPIPVPAAEAGKRFYEEALTNGDASWDAWLQRAGETRAKLAKFMNAEPKETAFVLNTSHGMNLIAGMLKGRGAVLTMRDEFPSTTYPWLHQGYKVKFAAPKNNIYSIADIEKALDGSIKILVASCVQYRTGFRQDLAELGRFCRSKGLIYVVNATQALGAMPVDVKKAGMNFMTFSCFKWTMSGYGIGGLYINKKWLGKIEFPQAGWRSVECPEDMDNARVQMRKEASAVEVGCGHFPNIFALGGALDLLDGIGIKNIQERIFSLNDLLVKKLEALGLEIVSPLEKEHRSGITVFKTAEPQKLVEQLKKRKIITAARGEGVRIALHIYNNEEDIEKLAAALKLCLRK